MKIRIKGNSLRLRLSQSEVKTVESNGMVNDSIDFGDKKLIYSLQVSGHEDISVLFNGDFITLGVPEEIIKTWTKTEQVGFNTEIPLNKGGHLSVLVEKDFQCMKPRDGEDEGDLFKNPLTD